MDNKKQKTYTVQDTHNALRKAVANTLARKKKLGHYSVQWQADTIVLEGQDAPELTKVR